MRHPGKEFEREIRNSLRDIPKLYWGRFFDFNTINASLQSLRGLSKRMGTKDKYKNFFLIKPPQQPADFWTVYRGSIYFFEAKKTINPDYFPLKNIKNHQLNAAFDMHKSGGTYVFLINKRNEPRKFKTFAVQGMFLWSLKEFGGENKIEWKYLDELAKEGVDVLEIERLPKGRWNIQKVFDKW